VVEYAITHLKWDIRCAGKKRRTCRRSMMQQHFEWHAGDIDDVLLWGVRPLFYLVGMVVMDNEIMQCSC